MSFADNVGAFAQLRRVLRSGGVLLLNVWDRIENNGFAETATTALSELFPDNPAQVIPRVPHGYFERDQIAGDLQAAGFAAPVSFTTVAARARASSARDVTIGYCLATPLRKDLEARGASRIDEVTDAVADAIAVPFADGDRDGAIDTGIQAVTSASDAPGVAHVLNGDHLHVEIRGAASGNRMIPGAVEW